MAGSGLAWYHSRAGLFDGMFFVILSIQLALALDRVSLLINFVLCLS